MFCEDIGDQGQEVRDPRPGAEKVCGVATASGMHGRKWLATWIGASSGPMSAAHSAGAGAGAAVFNRKTHSHCRQEAHQPFPWPSQNPAIQPLPPWSEADWQEDTFPAGSSSGLISQGSACLEGGEAVRTAHSRRRPRSIHRALPLVAMTTVRE